MFPQHELPVSVGHAVALVAFHLPCIARALAESFLPKLAREPFNTSFSMRLAATQRCGTDHSDLQLLRAESRGKEHRLRSEALEHATQASGRDGSDHSRS